MSMIQKPKREAAKATCADRLVARFASMLLIIAVGTFPIASAIHGSLATAVREWQGYYLGTWPGGLSLFGGAALGSLLMCFMIEPFLHRLSGK